VARNVAALVDEDARPVVNHQETRVLADDDYDRFLDAIHGSGWRYPSTNLFVVEGGGLGESWITANSVENRAATAPS
jgi:hypothetical protein